MCPSPFYLATVEATLRCHPLLRFSSLEFSRGVSSQGDNVADPSVLGRSEGGSNLLSVDVGAGQVHVGDQSEVLKSGTPSKCREKRCGDWLRECYGKCVLLDPAAEPTNF